MNCITRVFKINLVLVICALWMPFTANSAAISLDFSKFPDGSNASGQTITNQYESLGVLFHGLDNSVFSGAVCMGSGACYPGLTHSIESPFPWQKNGIVANFIIPILSIDVDVFGGRIGSPTNLLAYNITGELISQTSYYQADYLKGHASLVFNEDVSKIIWIGSVPYRDRVGIRNISFITVPTAPTLWLIGSGLIPLLWTRKRRNQLKSHSKSEDIYLFGFIKS